jgi:peptide-methionine (S)-S-oxide reductase
VTFDPRALPLETVLRRFWAQHTPMPLAFSGTQYRSAVFCHGESQMRVAEHVRNALIGESPFASPVDLTALEMAGDFFRAEEYHRTLASLNPTGGRGAVALWQ